MKNLSHIPLVVGATLLMSLFLIVHLVCMLLSSFTKLAVILASAYHNLVGMLDVYSLKAFHFVVDYVDSVLMGSK